MVPLFEMIKEYLDEMINTAIEEKFQSLSPHKVAPPKEKEIMSRKEVKELLQISYPTLNTWTKQGKIKAYKQGGKVYFKRSEIINSLEAKNFSKYKNYES
ncbi:MAG: helix-turn-helix domain-containing protein [Bacteroidetes bacterium]|nr:helix-turn-helix domain-containing protein [Bacteroidota bacterium]